MQGLIILLLIGVVATGVLALSHLEDQLVEVGGASLALAAAEVAGELDHFLFENYTVLKTLASHLGEQAHHADSLSSSLSSIKQSCPDCLWAGIVDKGGRVVAARDLSLGGDDHSWPKWFPTFRATTQPRVEVVDIKDGSLKGVAGKPVLLAVPLVNERGAFSGAVVSLLDPLAMERLVLETSQSMESRVQFSQGGANRLEYQVLTREGFAFLDSDPQQQGRLISQALQTESARLSENREAGYVEEPHWRRHVPVVSGYARTEGFHGFEGLDWIVFVRTDRSLIAAPVVELRWMLGVSLVLLGFPVVGFLLWTSGRLQRDYSRAHQESVDAKQAEQTLSEREERARLIVDTALDALISIDEEGRIVDWNLQAERTFGWMREEAIGHPILAKIIPQHYREIEELGLRRFLATGEAPQLNKLIEVMATRRDGREFPAELTVSPARVRDRFVFTVFLRDITERKQRERRLGLQYAVTRVLSEATTIEAASPRLLQTFCNHLEWELGIFWSVDQQAQALRLVEIWHGRGVGTAEFAAASREHVVNPGVGLPGRVWAQGAPIWIPDVLNDTNFPRAATAAKAGLRSAFAFPVRVGDTVLGVLEFFSHDIRQPDEDLLQMVVDIGVKVGQFVERKRAEGALRDTEEQLRQSQKMEAIGRLAGGVAHDFNNLLTVITGYTQLLLNQLGPNDRMRYEIEEIKKAGSRAGALTGQLLAFSRRQAISPQALNLNTIVSNMEGMLRRLLGEDIIDLATVQAPDLGMIKADPSQLEQVVMNLAVNACDAMPQGGKLTIELANATVAPDATQRPGSVEPGSYVLLTMTDTGCGMSEETLSHLFEPFFTTKDKGKGTGLGLSTVYGIVKQNDGHISVESQAGQGSTFKIYFPRVDAQEVKAEKGSEQHVGHKTGETILVIEDEPGVRSLVREMLKQRGYTVLEARDGINAQVVSKGHFGPIDLLLTDVVMPQKSGPEAAKELLSDRPDMKVLYMSGYPDHPVFSHGPLDKGKLLLQKPFTPETLVLKVREILDMPTEDFKNCHLVS